MVVVLLRKFQTQLPEANKERLLMAAEEEVDLNKSSLWRR